MRYLLIPISFIIWYAVTYYGLLLCFIGLSFSFSLNWIWIIVGYLFLVSITFAIANGIPSLLKLVVFKFYGINWFTCLIHSLAGVFGIIWFLYFYINNPPVIVMGKEEVFFLIGMWRLAPFKTILLVLPFFGIFISVVYSSTVAPVYIKIKGFDLQNDDDESQYNNSLHNDAQ